VVNSVTPPCTGGSPDSAMIFKKVLTPVARQIVKRCL
jgi:hypothetical protein